MGPAPRGVAAGDHFSDEADIYGLKLEYEISHRDFANSTDASKPEIDKLEFYPPRRAHQEVR
jgi:hypothetical protein